MTVIIGGSGTANGISYFSSPTTFAGTLNVSGTANVAQGLSTAARGINNASVPTGGVLQVVQQTPTNQQFSSSSSTYSNTYVTATITPQYSTSKILVMANFVTQSISNDNMSVGARIIRGASTVLYTQSRSAFVSVQYPTNVGAPQTLIYLDSPATTSSTVYTLQAARDAYGGSYGGSFAIPPTTDSYCNMTLIEIAG